jgi:hypothetical protein
MLIVITCALMFDNLLETALRIVYLMVKVSILNLTSNETPFKSTHASAYPLVHRTSASLRVDRPSRGSAKKFTLTSFFTYIKKDDSDKVVHVFEARKLSTMHCVLPKVIHTPLMINMTNFINEK